MGLLTVVILDSVIFATVGAALLTDSGRSRTGFMLGFLLGPVGAIIAAVMRLERPPTVPATEAATRTCPDCAEMVLAAARKCRFCGAALDPRTEGEQIDDRLNQLTARLSSSDAQQRESAVIEICQMRELGLPALSAVEKATQDPNGVVRMRAKWAVEELRRIARMAQ